MILAAATARSTEPTPGIVEGHAGGVDRAAGHLGAGEHVGHQVLERLERADRAAELLALLGVGHGQVGGGLGQAEQQAGDQRRALQPQGRGALGVEQPLALRQRRRRRG